MGSISIFPGWWLELQQERAKIGPAISKLMAATLDRREVKRFERALSSMAYALQMFACEAVHHPTVRSDVPLTATDLMLPGHMAIAYADAHPGGGLNTITIYGAELYDLAQSYRDFPSDAQEAILRDTAIDLRLGLRRRVRGEVAHGWLSRLAALALRDDQAEMLGGQDDGMPVLAMLGDTRDRGGKPSFAIRTLLTTVPWPPRAQDPLAACA
ncbi:MAG TPA: hypothetical protein VLA00_00865 [Xanthobacteraceae bacterium]|nr:hypothetical protein [Xanthobacteraceae bacterium]